MTLSVNACNQISKIVSENNKSEYAYWNLLMVSLKNISNKF